MREATATRLLIGIAAFWLLGVAMLGDARTVGMVLGVPGLLAPALCAREAHRGRWGAVAAWACCALVPLAFLRVLALADVHLHEFTGSSGASCDPMGPRAASHNRPRA